MQILDLPEEVLLHIIFYLTDQPRDLLNAGASCRVLFRLVRSPLIQLCLHHTLISLPPPATDSTASLPSLLKRLENLAGLRPTRTKSLVRGQRSRLLSSGTEPENLDAIEIHPINYLMRGDTFVSIEPPWPSVVDEVPIVGAVSALRVWDLKEDSASSRWVSPRRTVPWSKRLEDVEIDEEMDLLILVDSTTVDDRTSWTVHFLVLSTLEPHPTLQPLEHSTLLSAPAPSSFYQILSGSLLATSVVCSRAHWEHRTSTLTVWHIGESEVLPLATLSDRTDRLCTNFSFLTPNSIITLGDHSPDNDTEYSLLALSVHTFPSPADSSATTDGSPPKLRTRLRLWLPFDMFPFGDYSDSMVAQTDPFQRPAGDGVLAFCVVAMGDEDEDGCVGIVRRRAVLELLQIAEEKMEEEEPMGVHWMDWTDDALLLVGWSMTTTCPLSSTRVLLSGPAASVSGLDSSDTIETRPFLLDFSPHVVRAASCAEPRALFPLYGRSQPLPKGAERVRSGYGKDGQSMDSLVLPLDGRGMGGMMMLDQRRIVLEGPSGIYKIMEFD